jgi:hypothetical protein
MWLVLLIGVVLATGPLLDIVEDWRANCSARKDLSRMHSHEVAGHRWDCLHGQWMDRAGNQFPPHA